MSRDSVLIGVTGQLLRIGRSIATESNVVLGPGNGRRHRQDAGVIDQVDPAQAKATKSAKKIAKGSKR